MSAFKAKMHQIQFRLWLRPRPRCGSLQWSPYPLTEFKGLLLREGEGLGNRREKGDGKKGEGKGRRGGEGKGCLSRWSPPNQNTKHATASWICSFNEFWEKRIISNPFGSAGDSWSFKYLSLSNLVKKWHRPESVIMMQRSMFVTLVSSCSLTCEELFLWNVYNSSWWCKEWYCMLWKTGLEAVVLLWVDGNLARRCRCNAEGIVHT